MINIRSIIKTVLGQNDRKLGLGSGQWGEWFVIKCVRGQIGGGFQVVI